LNWDRERLDTWCERGILGLVLAILVYSPLALGAVRPQEFIVVEWLTVALLLVWCCRFWLNPKHRLLWPPVSWAVLLFMGYAVGRYLTSDVEYTARQEMIRVLVYGFIFFAVLNNLHRLETTQIVGMTLLFLAMAIAFYAVVQFLSDSEHVWHFLRPEDYRKRGSGTFICPNHLAGYLEMILPLGLIYTLTGRFNHVAKVVIGYASLMIFCGIAVTISRGGWAATTITLVALFIWLMRQRDYRPQGLLLLCALVAITVVFFIKAELSQGRKDRLVLASQTEDLRFKLWPPAVQIWKDNFWWGVGPGHFEYRFRQYRPPTPDTQIRADRVHNDYLNTLTDWGLIGALLVATAWGLFYWGVVRSWNYVQRAQNDFSAKRSNKASFVMGGTLGLTAILLHSVVDFNMQIPSNAILAVSLMALVSGYFRFATEAYWHTVRWPLRLLVTPILLSGALYLGLQSWQKTAECYWLGNAEKAPPYSPAQIAAFENAFRIDPKNFETAYKIGESLRMQSWEGGDDYRALADRAMKWFHQSMLLNRYDPYNFLRCGMCLDWLGQHDEAFTFYKQAQAIDPNSYYVLALLGWHYVQIEHWATAREWFLKSLNLFGEKNSIALSYLKIVDEKLAGAKK
jgi:O-antigen ligase